MMIYGGCLYMFPTLTIASTIGVVSFVGTKIAVPIVVNTYKVCRRKVNKTDEVVH
jgi:hypothetical protein